MKTLLAFTLAIILATPVLAQDAQPEISDDIRWMLATAQMNVSLSDEQDAVRTQTLKNAIVLGTLYRDKVDLSSSVRAIREIHQNTASASHRRLALAALQAIGTMRAHDYMARNTTPTQYDEGRLVVASVLNDYFVSQGAPADTSS